MSDIEQQLRNHFRSDGSKAAVESRLSAIVGDDSSTLDAPDADRSDRAQWRRLVVAVAATMIVIAGGVALLSLDRGIDGTATTGSLPSLDSPSDSTSRPVVGIDYPNGADDVVVLLENRGRLGIEGIGRVEIAIYGNRTFVAEFPDDDLLRTGTLTERTLQDVLRRADNAGLLDPGSAVQSNVSESCADDIIEHLTISTTGSTIRHEAFNCQTNPTFFEFLDDLRDSVGNAESEAFAPSSFVIVDEPFTCRFSSTRGLDQQTHPVFPHETSRPIGDIVPGCTPEGINADGDVIDACDDLAPVSGPEAPIEPLTIKSGFTTEGGTWLSVDDATNRRIAAVCQDTTPIAGRSVSAQLAWPQPGGVGVLFVAPSNEPTELPEAIEVITEMRLQDFRSTASLGLVTDDAALGDVADLGAAATERRRQLLDKIEQVRQLRNIVTSIGIEP